MLSEKRGNGHVKALPQRGLFKRQRWGGEKKKTRGEKKKVILTRFTPLLDSGGQARVGNGNMEKIKR